MKLVDILRRRWIKYILKPYFKAYSYKKLKRLNGYQLARFRENQKQFNERYQSIKHLISSDFTHATWKKFNDEMENQLLPCPKISFFHYPILLKTMTNIALNPPCELFVDQIKQNIQGMDVSNLAIEDLIGVPMLLTNSSLCKATSSGRITHIYQASICSKVTSAFKTTSVVTEWGGGFGGLARIFNKLEKLIGRTFTYNIIDLPIVSCLQWLYCASIIGEDRVNLVTEKHKVCVKGSINLIPNGLVKDMVNDLTCDLFVSSWALSESSLYAQEFVAKNKFFNARHGLVTHQASSLNHPYAGKLKDLLKKNSVLYDEQLVPHLNNESALFW